MSAKTNQITDQEMDELLVKDFRDPKKKEKRRKSAWRFFGIALALTIIFSVMNWGVITGWGNTRISEIQVVGDDGLRYTGYIYVPSSATNETPAPAMLVVHGNSGNARNHESWAVELARRGMVVITANTGGGGDGEYDNNYNRGSVNMFADYLENLPFVDQKQIVTAGHSAGCNPALDAAKTHGWKAYINCDNSNWMQKASEKNTYTCNTLVISGKGDRNDTVDKVRNGVKNVLSFRGIEVDAAKEDTLYGSYAEGTALELKLVDNMIHEGPLVNKTAIAHIIDFTQKNVSLPNALEGSNQVWQWKDVTGLLGMFSLFAFILSTANLLLQTEFFGEVASPMPRNIGLRGKGFVLSLVAAVVIPLIIAYTGTFGLAKALGDKNFMLFPLYASNRAFSAVVGINALAIIMLLVFHFTDGKKQNATLRDYGLVGENDKGFNFKLVAKSAALAVISLFCGWAILTMFHNMFGTDLYCLWWGYKTIPWHNFHFYIGYIVVWILCFIVAAIGLNVERRLPTTGDAKKDTIRQIVFNVVCSAFMITVLVLLQNTMQQSMNGTKALGTWGLDLTRLWGMPYGMITAGIGQTYCYRKTGNIWTGVFLMGILCALSCVLYGQFRMN